MKHSLHTVLTLLFVCASAWGENVPWQNPQINEINREPAHAHFIPYPITSDSPTMGASSMEPPSLMISTV